MLSDDAQFAIRAIKEAETIAYDTETSGLDWKRNWPVGYVITVPGRSVYIPVRHGGGGNLLDANCEPLKKADQESITIHRFEKELADAFKERDRRGLFTVGHNVKFDAHFSMNGGITVNRQLRDTSIYQPMLDEYSRSFSLDGCAIAHGVTPKAGEPLYTAMAARFGGAAERKIQMGRFWEMPGTDPVVMDYAAGDGVTTLELYFKQRIALDAQELGVVSKVEDELIWVLFNMERRGIKVDINRLGEVEQEINNKLNEAILALPAGYNSQSNAQTRALMEKHGHTDWPLTDAGNPSFPEKWLETKDIGKAIVKKRRYETLINRYTKPLRDHHIYKGRVHATLHQLANDEFGTISGRLACSDPNLQAVHKRNKELGRLFRSIYISDDGYDFYEGDYSQCEPRLFAHYSGDANLVRGYNSTPFVDAHQVVADLLNVERDPTAKRMNMGIFTGMFPEAFAGHMGWDLGRAKDAWNKWFEAFPGVRQFQNLAKDTFKGRGYVKTLLGRRCRIDHPRFAYRGTSRIIQGGNADILKHKLVEAEKFCEANGKDNIHLLMTVHDSFDWQAVKGEKGEKMSMELAKVLEDVQTPPFNLIVPFVVDWKKGPNWAIATYGSK